MSRLPTLARVLGPRIVPASTRTVAGLHPMPGDVATSRDHGSHDATALATEGSRRHQPVRTSRVPGIDAALDSLGEAMDWPSPDVSACIEAYLEALIAAGVAAGELQDAGARRARPGVVNAFVRAADRVGLAQGELSRAVLDERARRDHRDVVVRVREVG